MKRTLLLTYSLLFALLVFADGNTIVHNFNSAAASTPTRITFTNENKVGTMSDGRVYTCYGSVNTKFLLVETMGSLTYNEVDLKICQGDSVIITPAVERLDHIEISRIPNGGNLRISVSLNNSSWTTVSEDQSLYGDYYISIKNIGSSPAYIRSIEYTTHPDCGCFPYVPEL